MPRIYPEIVRHFQMTAFMNYAVLKYFESDCSKRLEPDIPAD